MALAAPGLELTEEVPSVVEAFRKLCGPADPEVCRVLYPDSLRAKYGGNLFKLSIYFFVKMNTAISIFMNPLKSLQEKSTTPLHFY